MKTEKISQEKSRTCIKHSNTEHWFVFNEELWAQIIPESWERLLLLIYKKDWSSDLKQGPQKTIKSIRKKAKYHHMFLCFLSLIKNEKQKIIARTKRFPYFFLFNIYGLKHNLTIHGWSEMLYEVLMKIPLSCQTILLDLTIPDAE